MSMIELVIYIAILTIITVVIVSGIVQMAQVFGKSRNERKVSLAAETALERIVREIRLAKSVVVGCTPAPCISLDSFSSHDVTNPSTISVTKKFAQSGNRLVLYPDFVNNPATVQDLTPSNVTVSGVSFTQLPRSVGIKSSVSQAVRVVIAVSTGAGTYTVSHVYNITAVMRGSYE